MARTRWVYETDQIYESELEDTLNDWGSRGWELVALLPPRETDHPHLYLAVLKISDEESRQQRMEQLEHERLKRRARGRVKGFMTPMQPKE